jgi:hypothetical protein
MNPGVQAITELVRIGYEVDIEGEKITMRYRGSGLPNPAQVLPILDLVRQHKEDVQFFLRCYCPKCGGAAFGIFAGVSRCMACYWDELTRLYSEMVQRERYQRNNRLTRFTRTSRRGDLGKGRQEQGWNRKAD